MLTVLAAVILRSDGPGGTSAFTTAF